MKTLLYNLVVAHLVGKYGMTPQLQGELKLLPLLICGNTTLKGFDESDHTRQDDVQ